MIEKLSSLNLDELYRQRIFGPHVSHMCGTYAYGVDEWRPIYTSSLTSTDTTDTIDTTTVSRYYEPDVYSTYVDGECDMSPDIKILKEELRDIMGTTYRVVCKCKNGIDFDPKYILKNLSIMKSNLMLTCAPVRVKNIDCKMTPKVKENLIMAYKRNKSFGKELPIVPRFDEFMNRLPDKININTLNGMNITVVDPNVFGKYYLEFEAIVLGELKNK